MTAQGAARQVFFEDQGVGEIFGLGVRMVLLRGNARGSEQFEGVVPVEGLFAEWEAHLGVRDQAPPGPCPAKLH